MECCCTIIERFLDTLEEGIRELQRKGIEKLCGVFNGFHDMYMFLYMSPHHTVIGLGYIPEEQSDWRKDAKMRKTQPVDSGGVDCNNYHQNLLKPHTYYGLCVDL